MEQDRGIDFAEYEPNYEEELKQERKMRLELEKENKDLRKEIAKLQEQLDEKCEHEAIALENAFMHGKIDAYELAFGIIEYENDRKKRL